MAQEKNFENRLKKYLHESNCWYVKYWAGAAFTRSGIPDLLVCSEGCFMGIEVKGEGGKPTLLQLYHLQAIRDSGGYGILLYPKDFEAFKKFNEKKSKSNMWYLQNIEEQEEWTMKLDE